MAEAIIKRVLDTVRSNKNIAIISVREDNKARFINAVIATDGVPLRIESDLTVLINASRADGESKSFEGEVNADGTVTVPITHWMLDIAYTAVDCTVSVHGTDGEKLSTTNFDIEVEDTPNEGTNVSPDDSEYESMMQLLKRAEEAAARAEEAADRAESGGGGNGGGTGENGATFTPDVSEDGVISWTNDKGLENPAPVNIRGPQGEKGDKGDKGDTGADGKDGEDYVLTEADKAEIAEKVEGATVVQAPKFVNSVDEMTDTSRVYVMASTGKIWAYMDTSTEQEVTVTDELDDKTFLEGNRLSSSATNFTDGFSNDATGYNVTPLIDLTKDKYQGKEIVIHLEGSQYVTAASATWIQHRAYGYDGTVRYVRAATYPNASDSIALWKGATFNIINDTKATLTITPPLKYGSSNYDIGYLRFCGKGSGASSNVYITYRDMQTVTGGQWVDTGTSYSPSLSAEDLNTVAEQAAAIVDNNLLAVIGSGEVIV